MLTRSGEAATMKPSKQVMKALKAIDTLNTDGVLSEELESKWQEAFNLLEDTMENLKAAGL
jgi:hypothetical protein